MKLLDMKKEPDFLEQMRGALAPPGIDEEKVIRLIAHRFITDFSESDADREEAESLLRAAILNARSCGHVWLVIEREKVWNGGDYTYAFSCYDGYQSLEEVLDAVNPSDAASGDVMALNMEEMALYCLWAEHVVLSPQPYVSPTTKE